MSVRKKLKRAEDLLRQAMALYDETADAAVDAWQLNEIPKRSLDQIDNISIELSEQIDRSKDIRRNMDLGD